MITYLNYAFLKMFDLTVTVVTLILFSLFYFFKITTTNTNNCISNYWFGYRKSLIVQLYIKYIHYIHMYSIHFRVAITIPIVMY